MTLLLAHTLHARPLSTLHTTVLMAIPSTWLHTSEVKMANATSADTLCTLKYHSYWYAACVYDNLSPR